ncbi:MAG: hypothetical protein LBR21_10395 [Propionibacteriaceae bacterium]|nr:hypothetical protein [Propionibacteriaceae bacterium]
MRKPSFNRALALLVAVCGLLLGLSVGATWAALTDRAGLNVAFGSGQRFDLAISLGGLHEAEKARSAVPVQASPDVLDPFMPAVFSAKVVNKKPGLPGDLSVRLWDPDPEPGDLFGRLRFFIDIDGRSVAVGLTAAEINRSGVAMADVEPGEEHNVRVAVLLDPADAAKSAADRRGTAVGLKVEGMSR